MKDIQQRTFWLVWAADGFPPNFKHSSYISAVNEAERLARQNRDKTFIVLQGICAKRASDLIHIELTTDSDIPF